MNETFGIRAIVLRRDDYQEVDSQVLVYSLERGLMNLVVRGTKRPKSKLAAHIEPISLVEIMVIRGKGKDYVGSALAQDCFRVIKEDYEKIQNSGEILRNISEIVKVHEVDENIFYLLFDFLNNLNSADLKLTIGDASVNFFMLKFMALLGYQPVLESCLLCDENVFFGKIFFNNKKGGLVCEKCVNNQVADRGDNTVISVAAVSGLKNILENDFKTIFGYTLANHIRAEIAKVISFFEEYHLN